MESSGEYFKREREQRGIKLQSVYEATRVPLKYLKAIESDDYDILPNTIFVKGYIRSYCKFIGIDPNEAILKFEMHFKEHASSNAPAELKEIKPSEYGKGGAALSYPKNTAKIAAIVIAVAVLIVIVYSSVTRRNARNEEIAVTAGQHATTAQSPVAAQTAQTATQTEAKPAESAAAPNGEPVKPAESKPVAAVDALKAEKVAVKALPKAEAKPEVKAEVKPETKAAVKSDIKPATAPVSAAAHTLTLKATQPVWIRVRIDSAEPKEVTLKPDETIVWKAAEDFSLLFGNAGGVTVKLDGVDLGVPGKEGEVLSLKLPKTARVKTADPSVKNGATEKKVKDKKPDEKQADKDKEDTGSAGAPKQQHSGDKENEKPSLDQ